MKHPGLDTGKSQNISGSYFFGPVAVNHQSDQFIGTAGLKDGRFFAFL